MLALLAKSAKIAAGKVDISSQFDSGYLKGILTSCQSVIAASLGPFATICCKPRQIRKEATVAADAGAGVRLNWLLWFWCP